MNETFPPDGAQTPANDQGFTPDYSGPQEPLSTEEEVRSLNLQLDEMRMALQRVQADFVNYKRRSDQEREDMMGRLNAGLITRLLPVLDDLVMALGHVPEAPEGRAWADGMGLINRKLHTILESEGAWVIEAEGSEFDPSQHESLGFQESTTHPEGQVVSVVRSGYTLNGRVLRPAQVIVARNPEPQQ